MNRKLDITRSNAGAVLLAAMGILVLFSMLGIAYVDYMLLEVKDTRVDLEQVHVQSVAKAGVQAAIHEMQQAFESGQNPLELASQPMDVTLSVYGVDTTGQAPLAELGQLTARVTISDESGKLNLNHAPPRALESILGVDGNTARIIRSNLPVSEVPAKPQVSFFGKRIAPAVDTTPKKNTWLASINDLSARKLVPDSVLAALDKKLVTVYSVTDHNSPTAFLNINAAPEKVLAAVLDIKPEAAELVAKKRPFASLADMCAAAGKDASTFNFPPSPEAPNALPPELSFESRCFRFVSEAVINGEKTNSSVEAVVVFGASGPQITYWNESVVSDETVSS